MSSLEKCLLRSSAHFFKKIIFLIQNFMNYYYILEINPLPDVSFADIFSYSLVCLFFFMVSFAVQKLVSLIRSHMFIFGIISITLGGRLKKRCCCNLCQRGLCVFLCDFCGAQPYF